MAHQTREVTERRVRGMYMNSNPNDLLPCADFVHQLSKSGVSFRVVDGKLIVNAATPLSNSTQAYIKRNKQSIIDYLNTLKPNLPANSKLIPLTQFQNNILSVKVYDDDLIDFNMPGLLRLRLSDSIEIDLEKLIRCLVLRHPMLRAVLKIANDQLMQTLLPVETAIDLIIGESEIEHLDPEISLESRHQDIKERLRILKGKAFDIMKRPSLRLVLIEYDRHEWACLFVTHHLFSDRQSNHILAGDIEKIITGDEYKATGDNSQICHFFDYVTRLGTTPDQHLAADYWQRLFEKYVVNESEYRSVSKVSGKTVKAAVGISNELLAAINRFSAKNNATLFDVMLSFFVVHIYETTPDTSLIVSVPTSVRNEGVNNNSVGPYVCDTFYIFQRPSKLTVQSVMKQVYDQKSRIMKEPYCNEEETRAYFESNGLSIKDVCHYEFLMQYGDKRSDYRVQDIGSILLPAPRYGRTLLFKVNANAASMAIVQKDKYLLIESAKVFLDKLYAKLQEYIKCSTFNEKDENEQPNDDPVTQMANFHKEVNQKDKQSLAHSDAGQEFVDRQMEPGEIQAEQSVIFKHTKLWEKVLGRKLNLNHESSFFQLGGRSIDVVKLHSLTQDMFGLNFRVNDFYTRNQFGQQCAFISERMGLIESRNIDSRCVVSVKDVESQDLVI